MSKAKTKEIFYEGMRAQTVLDVMREHKLRSRNNPQVVGKNEFGFIIKWTPGTWSLTIARPGYKEVFKVIKATKVIGIIEDVDE